MRPDNLYEPASAGDWGEVWAIERPPAPLPLPRRRRLLPAILFLATCVSTFWAGTTLWFPIFYMDSFERAGEAICRHWQQGLLYMAAVLAILLTHEMGHFVMALRHRIPASLPYFIPVPFTPFGTMGAVIGMQGSRANRRQMFDLGLAGPLAGLAVALPVLWIGIRQFQPGLVQHPDISFPMPLVFKFLFLVVRPDYPTNGVLHLSELNPWLTAGWVGMLVTGLNMLPVSQLDGGHVAYALLGRRAHILARGLLVGAILFILIWEQYAWVLMVVVVTLLGTDHPPTADDSVGLGWRRRLLGWLSLAIPIFCLPPAGLS
jgi:membrane-associated protease RseP (regulator of RpoE activity)